MFNNRRKKEEAELFNQRRVERLEYEELRRKQTNKIKPKLARSAATVLSVSQALTTQPEKE